MDNYAYMAGGVGTMASIITGVYNGGIEEVVLIEAAEAAEVELIVG